MKKMTEYQRELVTEHIDLVECIIKRRIKVNGGILLTYDDFYQIGCEALCRAAQYYDPNRGKFEALASTYIYNAIIDHCRKQNSVSGMKYDYFEDSDHGTYAMDYLSCTDDCDEMLYLKRVAATLHSCKQKYNGITLKGIEAIELKSLGYSTREIAERYETTVNNVNAWMSRARSRLQADDEILAAAW